MDSLDQTLLTVFNQFARRSWLLDRAMEILIDNVLLKGGLLMAAYLWVWFREGDRQHLPDPDRWHAAHSGAPPATGQGPEGSSAQEVPVPAEAVPLEAMPAGRRNREKILASLGGVFLALAVAQILLVTLPHRPRPVTDPDAGVRTAYGLRLQEWQRWSSLPSDHATLFFGLATGLALVSRWLGLFAFAHAVLIATMPRLYLAVHYPTDIAAGALLGSGFVLLANVPAVRRVTVAPLLGWGRRHPGLFYAILFLGMLEVAILFEDARELLKFGGQVAKRLMLGGS